MAELTAAILQDVVGGCFAAGGALGLLRVDSSTLGEPSELGSMQGDASAVEARDWGCVASRSPNWVRDFSSLLVVQSNDGLFWRSFDFWVFVKIRTLWFSTGQLIPLIESLCMFKLICEGFVSAIFGGI